MSYLTTVLAASHLRALGAVMNTDLLASIVAKGDYDNTAAYVASNLVGYNGSTYYLPANYVGSLTGTAPPALPWKLFVASSADNPNTLSQPITPSDTATITGNLGALYFPNGGTVALADTAGTVTSFSFAAGDWLTAAQFAPHKVMATGTTADPITGFFYQ